MSDLNAMVVGRPASFDRLLYFYQFREVRPREAPARAAVPALQGAPHVDVVFRNIVKKREIICHWQENTPNWS